VLKINYSKTKEIVFHRSSARTFVMQHWTC